MATNNVDDPWHWTVSRVCQELTTNNRSWEPPALSSPNLDLLRQNLLHHGVNGQVLLTSDFTRQDLCNSFKIFVLNQQSWLLDAIRQFKLASPQYLSQYPAPVSHAQVMQEIFQAISNLRHAIFGPPAPNNPWNPLPQPGPQPALPAPSVAAVSSTTVATLPAPQLPVPGHPAAAVSSSNSSHTTSVDTSGLNADGDQDATGEKEANGGQGLDELAAKRLKSGSADPTGDAAPQFADDVQDQETDPANDQSAFVPSPEPSTLDPESSVEPVCSTVEGPTLVPSLEPDTPSSPETGVASSNVGTDDGGQAVVPSPGLSTPMVPETAVGPSVPSVQGDSQVPTSQPEVEPPVKKQPKRLSLGMLTQIGEIDPNRNRAVPTYEDDILGLDIPDSNIAGRKRVAPQLLPLDSEEYAKTTWATLGEDDISSDQSDVEATNQLHQEQSDQGSSEPSENPIILANILPAIQPANPPPANSTRRRRARPAKYLPRDKLSVDDLFYGKVPFGADLSVGSIEPEDKYFSHTNSRKLPAGRVRYVGKMLRNFMLSKQDLNRTPRASGPNFSTNLLAVDITRDAEGKAIPPVVFDPSIFADVVGVPFVEESDEEPQEASNPEVPSGDSHVVSGETTEQQTLPEVTSEASKSGEGEVEEQVKDDKTYTYYTAVRTYHEGNGKVGFMTLLDTPSFTLYYTTPEGEIRARRERLVDWPELIGSQVPEDFVAYDPLQLIGNRPAVDPDSLRHWTDKPSVELPKWGESGDEGAYDSDTWREIDRDNGDVHRRQTRQRGTLLNPIQINNIWNQAVNDYIEKWQKQKLPKLENTAAGIWLTSRRNRTKRIQVQAARNDLQNLQTRLANLQAQFTNVPWSSWSQALKGCRNIEFTVLDIQTLQWTIDTLEKKTSPGMPFLLPSKRVSKLKAKAPVAAREAEDDVDDGLGDFIINDEEFDAEGSEEEEQMVDLMEDSDDAFEEGDHPKKDRRSLDRSANHLSTPVRKSKVAKRTSGVIDLTDSPPLAPSLGKTSGVIDLVTPEKTTPKTPKFKINSRSISPLVISSGSEVELPPIDNPMAIAEFPYEYWQKARDVERLLIRVFYKLRDPQPILRLFASCKEETLWELMCQVLRALQLGNDEVDGMDPRTFDRLTEIAQLLAMYMDCSYVEWGRDMHEILCRVLLGAKGWWHGFYKLCSRMEKYLNGSSSPEPPSPSPLGKGSKVNKRQLADSDDDDQDPTKRRRIRHSTTTSDDIPEELSPNLKRKRPVAEDANARNLRTRNHERLAEQEKRRRVLKAALAQSGHTLGSGKAKYIINDAATLDQGHVYVNDDIATSIKPHQVEGVRFMWNQVIAGEDDSSSQGCLLAHTMGLGKTMQVITLLVAIEAAASSSDPSISSQIPSCLKGTTRTLILCPPGLIDNWWDECLRWAPENPSDRTVLGGLYKVSSGISVAERLQEISAWHEAGGVLIIGYEMLRSLVLNKEMANRPAALTEVEHERILDQLLKGPDMIIADEAHKLKNAKSGIAEAASQFESTRRIALTGSPLANNVEEYHSMIDFVAPNYLGSVVEFRAYYKEPIEAGLFQESTPFEIKLSRKRLRALNTELALKVHRMDVSVLNNDLPPKKEFVISIPLTDLQRKVYSSYVKSLHVRHGQLTNDGDPTQTTIWSWLSMLSLLCNHPWCFNTKIQEAMGTKPKPGTPEDATDDNAIPLMADAPLSKGGLSTAFVEEVTQLFEKEDLYNVGLSYKATLLCQILDAAKIATDKTLVFSSSIPTLDFLENLFKRQGRSFARLDGKTPMSKRQGLIKAFNAGGKDIYLISTTAGGLGLNLQSANRVVIFDFKYNPIHEQQAVGRAFRIGQLKPTFVYRFVCGGTFEANIHNKTVFKSQLASSVVDKRNLIGAAEKRIGDILFEPKDTPQKDLSEFEGMDPAVLDKILATQGQTATIRSIVQTDTFEIEDMTQLTPEDMRDADIDYKQRLLTKHAAKAGPLSTPQIQAQPPNKSTMQLGLSAAPQGQVQIPTPSVNRPGPPAIPQPQPTGYGNSRKETPIRPPSGTPQGSSTPYSNAAGPSSGSSGGFNRSNPPIMGANTRALSQTPSPYRKAADAHHQSSKVSNAGTPSGTSDLHAPLPASSGGSQLSKPQKFVNDFFPVLADGYKSKQSGGGVAATSSTASSTSPLPETVRKRIRVVADEITAAVAKYSTLGPDRLQQMDSVSKMLDSNHAMVCQLIDSKLSAYDFVQGLAGRGLGSDPQTSAMFRVMNGQFSSSSSPQNLKAPVTSKQTKNDDARLMARIDRNRLAKGESPVSKPSKERGQLSEHAKGGAVQAEESLRS